MKHIIPAISLALAAPLHAEDPAKLILPGSAFGDGWELAQPAVIGDSAAPNYINRALPHQPVVSINVIAFPSSKLARERWEKKFGGPEAAKVVKKCPDMSDAYDNIPPAHNKRYILLGKYWLTVEQVGDKDDRKIFIEKYFAHIKKIG